MPTIRKLMPADIDLYQAFMDVIFPGISFREWQHQGHWTQLYSPYAIIENGKIVSNASVAEMNLLIDGQSIPAVQIGGVGTPPSFRKMGYSRRIMEKVIYDCREQDKPIFLFANETVMDFYPRFGFENYVESIFRRKIKLHKADKPPRKLNPTVKEDYGLIQQMFESRLPLSVRFGALDHSFISMWYVHNFFTHDFFFIEDEAVLVIMKKKDDCLQVFDVVFQQIPDWEVLLRQINVWEGIHSIEYYFCPDQLNFAYDEIFPEQNGLFVLGNIEMPDEPFVFPATATT